MGRRDHDVDVAHPFVVHQLVQKHPGQPGSTRPGHSDDDAALFSHGRSVTERRIAGELVVSVKTVEYHLRNAFAKLGITRRRQLAARLGERPA